MLTQPFRKAANEPLQKSWVTLTLSRNCQVPRCITKIFENRHHKLVHKLKPSLYDLLMSLLKCLRKSLEKGVGPETPVHMSVLPVHFAFSFWQKISIITTEKPGEDSYRLRLDIFYKLVSFVSKYGSCNLFQSNSQPITCISVSVF
jgi:hypothetical protein